MPHQVRLASKRFPRVPTSAGSSSTLCVARSIVCCAALVQCNTGLGRRVSQPPASPITRTVTTSTSMATNRKAPWYAPPIAEPWRSARPSTRRSPNDRWSLRITSPILARFLTPCAQPINPVVDDRQQVIDVHHAIAIEIGGAVCLRAGHLPQALMTASRSSTLTRPSPLASPGWGSMSA